jgi:catechol 2,3-dioxygenase-like lactoylglutathione lyase family enzyme
MFTGAHIVIFSTDAEADRAVFRDLLGFRAVDAGEGWLCFAMPPAEAAFHPSDGDTRHEFHFTCADIDATREALAAKGLHPGEISDEGWGRVLSFVLPGGSKIGVYKPRHPTAF